MGPWQPFKKLLNHASLAQSGSEQLFYMEKVIGSNPIGSTKVIVVETQQ